MGLIKKIFTRGGRRKGAGRKPQGDKPMHRINVMLGDEHLQRARWIGEGNISLGIRRALLTCPEFDAAK